LGHEF
jgi:hypothetical protein